MNEYKRLTEKDGATRVMSQWAVTSNELKIYRRLGELEDKIENGTLVERPPVKVGDRIWIARKYWDYFGGRTKKEVVGRVVKRIFLNNDNSLTFSCLAIHKGTKLISIVKSTTFNKTWFLTEAEAKLKELQEKQK